MDGRARYCQKCNYAKPDRTHHCSICRRCILKMDHHCPWLGTCIGFGNYKSFVLFLCYLSLFCFDCCVTCGVSLWYWISYVSPVGPWVRRWLMVECGLFTCAVDFTCCCIRRGIPLRGRFLNMAHHVRLPTGKTNKGTSATTPQQ